MSGCGLMGVKGRHRCVDLLQKGYAGLACEGKWDGLGLGGGGGGGGGASQGCAQGLAALLWDAGLGKDESGITAALKHVKTAGGAAKIVAPPPRPGGPPPSCAVLLRVRGNARCRACKGAVSAEEPGVLPVRDRGPALQSLTHTRATL